MPARAVTAAAAVAVAGAALVATAGVPLSTAAASTRPSTGFHLNNYEYSLLVAVNNVRSAHHLPRLRLLQGPTTVARSWTLRMASGHTLAHNPRIETQIETHGCYSWSTIDENVGYGPAGEPTAVFRAYLASPRHRANILDPHVKAIGVGAVTRGSVTYDTIDFVAGC